ncbi:MAG: alpha/beta fold hydrolase [Armatimonadota bacterium]|nr:alpha/beta fold hydrolase [Armatimonadota bacterium]
MNTHAMIWGAALLIAGSALAAAPGQHQKPAAKKPAPVKAAMSAVGDWGGTLHVNGTDLRLVLHFVRKTGGGLTGRLDSLDQNARGIPFSIVRQSGRKVHVEAAVIHGTYDGTLTASGKTMAGTWTQGVPLPLTLTRLTAASAAIFGKDNRPQEPKPPFPYTVKTVTFPGGAAGVTLAGTLTQPPGDGPFPAAVLIAGSGPNDRDETILGHKPFWVLADSLTRRGIAVLRYDKRGIGQSTGLYAEATSQNFAQDAQAAADYLKMLPQIAPRKIGLIGHSEGGLIAPMVAAKSPDIAYIVLLAGTGVPGEQILLEQSALISKVMGIGEAKIAKNQALRKEMFDLIAQEPDLAVARTKVSALLHQAVATMTADEKKQIGNPEAFIQVQMQFAASPWMHFFLTYDPAPTLKQVRCPVLALDGSLDLQVPPAENLAAIAAALKAGGNTDVTTQELPGLNHLFQTAKTGSPSEYAHIEETIAPVVLTTVGDWIMARTAGK